MGRNKYPEETVAKILDAALELFCAQGYEGTSIQDIVDRLDGMTKGAVYHHFKSKEEIFNAAFDRAMTPIVSGSIFPYPGSSSGTSPATSRNPCSTASWSFRPSGQTSQRISGFSAAGTRIC